MKKQQSSFFTNLFGPKGLSADHETSASSRVVITSDSQPHVLQQKMREQKMSHGETVMANISPVRLATDYGKMVMYFCPVKTIEVLKKVAAGDGGEIPTQAIVEGLTIPADYKPGLYTLKNVKISSNGTMQVMATSATEWEVA